MTDQEQRMNSLKKELRSLLTPIKEGLTPSQLEQEYKIMIGKMLPLRMLGYHSVMELVKDMPDTVNISPKGNGTVILKGGFDFNLVKVMFKKYVDIFKYVQCFKLVIPCKPWSS